MAKKRFTFQLLTSQNCTEMISLGTCKNNMNLRTTELRLNIPGAQSSERKDLCFSLLKSWKLVEKHWYWHDHQNYLTQPLQQEMIMWVSSRKLNGTSAVKMDSENKESDGHCCLVSSINSAAVGTSNKQFIQLYIFHVMVLVHRTMENSETCQLFVEKSGIETLLKLLSQPNNAQSFEGMPVTLHSTMVYKRL